VQTDWMVLHGVIFLDQTSVMHLLLIREVAACRRGRQSYIIRQNDKLYIKICQVAVHASDAQEMSDRHIHRAYACVCCYLASVKAEPTQSAKSCGLVSPVLLQKVPLQRRLLMTVLTSDIPLRLRPALAELGKQACVAAASPGQIPIRYTRLAPALWAHSAALSPFHSL